MKLKRFLVFALVLALSVFVFAACDGPTETETNAPGTETEIPGTETEAPDTETEAPDTETEAPDTETEAPDTETEAPDTETETEPHTHEVEVEEKQATCTATGYRKEVCKTCGTVVSETTYEKLAHTPKAEATCAEASVCSVCGTELEAAKAHTWGEAVVVDATCLNEGTSTKTCSVCGATDVTKTPATGEHEFRVRSRVLPATCQDVGYEKLVCYHCKTSETRVLTKGHNFATDSADATPFTVGEDGKLYGFCVDCNSRVQVVSAQNVLRLDFDKESLKAEVEALANETNGFIYDEVYVGGQDGAFSPKISASALQISHNKSAIIAFNGGLLSDAEYYAISFNWRATKLNAASSARNIGVFGITSGAASGQMAEADFAYAWMIERLEGGFKAAAGDSKFELSATVNQWYDVKIIVNNTTGIAYVYIDGEFFAANTSGAYAITADETFSWRFGGEYNVFHLPEFDNFSIDILESAAAEEENPEGSHIHRIRYSIIEANCVTEGYYKEICIDCGEVLRENFYTKGECEVLPATCTEPSHCKFCNKVYGPANGHTFGEDAIIIEGTCLKDGSREGTCTVCGENISENVPAPHMTPNIGDLDKLTIVDGKIKTECVICKEEVDITDEIRLQLDFEEASRDEFLAVTYPMYGVEMKSYVSTAGREIALKKLEDGRTVLRLKDNESVIVAFDEKMLSDAEYYMISFDWRVNKLGASTGAQHAFGFSPAGVYEGTKWLFAIDRSTGDLSIPGGEMVNDVSVAVDEWCTISIVVNNTTGGAYIYIDSTLLGYCESGFAITDGTQQSGSKLGWFLGGQFNVNHQPEMDNFQVTLIDTSCDHVEGPAATCTEAKTCIYCSYVYDDALGHDPTGVVVDQGQEATCIEKGYVVMGCSRCDGIRTETDVLEHSFSVETEHKNPTCTEDGYSKGICDNGCGKELTEVIPARHITPISGDLDKLTIVDGKVQVACVACGEQVDVTNEIRLQLDFDEKLAKELAEQATENHSFGTFESNTSYPNKVENSVLYVHHNSSTYVTFDASLLEDSDYYVVSFDWRATAFDATKTDSHGVFALSRVDLNNNVHTTNFGLNIHRGNGTFSPATGSGKFSLVAEKDQWYAMTLVVDNTTGYSYLYIDGECYAAYANANFMVSQSKQGAERLFAWRFGGQFNIAHKPQFDNFKVMVLDTSCNHESDAVATCTEAEVCKYCNKVLKDALGHVPTGNIIEDVDAPDCSTIGYTVEECGNGCAGIRVDKPVLHTPAAIGTDLSQLTIVDGKIQVECGACHQMVDATEDVRLALDFDKATVEEEFAAYATEDNGLTYVNDKDNQKITSTGVAGERTVMNFDLGAPSYIHFDHGFLSDASVYVISFDWRFTRQATSEGQLAVIGSTPKNSAGAIKDYGNLMKFNKITNQLTDGSSTVYMDMEKDQWYTMTVVVDNTTGNANLYVDGVYIRTLNGMFLVSEAKQLSYGEGATLCWRLNEAGNVHEPQYDNFRVTVVG